MGKLKKEVIDKIRRLGGEGYSITEIVDMVDAGRDAVRKYLVDGDSSVVLDGAGGAGLSDGITRRLYDLQGILSASSISDAVERAYRDEVSAVKFKLAHWEKYAAEDEEFSIEGMVKHLTEHIRDLEFDDKIATNIWEKNKAEIVELKESAEERYEEGYQKGQNDYGLLVPCTICGNPITLTSGTEIHRHIVEFCREQGIIHNDCIPRYKRIFA